MNLIIRFFDWRKYSQLRKVLIKLYRLCPIKPLPFSHVKDMKSDQDPIFLESAKNILLFNKKQQNIIRRYQVRDNVSGGELYEPYFKIIKYNGIEYVRLTEQSFELAKEYKLIRDQKFQFWLQLTTGVLFGLINTIFAIINLYLFLYKS